MPEKKTIAKWQRIFRLIKPISKGIAQNAKQLNDCCFIETRKITIFKPGTGGKEIEFQGRLYSSLTRCKLVEECFEPWREQYSQQMPFQDFLNTYLSALAITNPAKRAELIPSRGMTYLSTKMRESYRLTADSKQKILKVGNKTLIDGNYIFVITPDRKIYIGKKIHAFFHHCSFLRGGAVLCAGELTVEGGRITEVNNKSGHYHCEDERLDLVEPLFKDLFAKVGWRYSRSIMKPFLKELALQKELLSRLNPSVVPKN